MLTMYDFYYNGNYDFCCFIVAISTGNVLQSLAEQKNVTWDIVDISWNRSVVLAAHKEISHETTGQNEKGIHNGYKNGSWWLIPTNIYAERDCYWHDSEALLRLSRTINSKELSYFVKIVGLKWNAYNWEFSFKSR